MNKKTHTAGSDWTKSSLSRSKASSEAAGLGKSLGGGSRVKGTKAPSGNKGARIRGR